MARYKPSRTAAREFAQEMERIEIFCSEHGIRRSASSDSYYFSVNGTKYRVSNHTRSASDKGMYDMSGYKVRESYHDKDDDTVCITAGKTRIIEIYNALVAGKELDGRGYVKGDTK